MRVWVRLVRNSYMSLTGRAEPCLSTRLHHLAFFVDSSTVEMEAIRSFETSENTNLAAQRHTPKDPLRNNIATETANLTRLKYARPTEAVPVPGTGSVGNCTCVHAGSQISRPVHRQSSITKSTSMILLRYRDLKRPPTPHPLLFPLPVTAMLTMTPSSESTKSQIMVYW